MSIKPSTIEDAAKIHQKLVAGADKRRFAKQARIALRLAPVALAIGAAIAVVGLPKDAR